MKSSIAMVDISVDPWLREAMNEASRRDSGHHAPLATHVFVRDDFQIVGAAGIAVPTLTFWAASTSTPRESWEMTKLANERMATLHENFLAPCAPDSPFFPLMGRLGYRRIGPADFFEHR